MMMRLIVLRLAVACILAVFPCVVMAEEKAAGVIDSGNTAWLLISSALVMLMTPGLAFFYGGMVRGKNVVSTLLQNYIALALVGVIWAVIGYSLVFSEGNPFIGGFSFAMLNNVGQEAYATYGVPHIAFVCFQMMFAIITPALITGAFAERINFRAWLLILSLWSVAVYAPVAHWVWGPNGWLASLGGLDFAGGIVVHISSGFSALIAALLFGRRKDFHEETRPYDVSMIMLGAALLWFGWFGFNAGSAIVAGGLAAHAFATTFLCAASASLSWMAADWIKEGKPTAVGGAMGTVVGLVAITPAAGFVSTTSALIMGVVAGIACNICTRAVKRWWKIDDALDVFACHGMGGLIGAVLTGLLASKTVNPSIPVEGLLISGEPSLFIANLVGSLAVCVYAMSVTFVIIKLVGKFVAIRVSEDEEEFGLDHTQHGEFVMSTVNDNLVPISSLRKTG